MNVQNIQVHWFKNGYDFFSSACSTVQYVLHVLTFCSQRCFSALLWVDVPLPSIAMGPRPVGAGFYHGVVGVTTVSIARALACSSLRMA
jgi:hypothetical protein